MTESLARRLWRLSEAGEPAIMFGRQHAPGEEAHFERLVQLGVLLRRGCETTWPRCDDCDCGTDERRISWEGDVAKAKCDGDRGRDEILQPDDLHSFAVAVPAFMEAVAVALGFGPAEQIGPGLWHLGRLPDGRIVVAAPSRAGALQPGLAGALRTVHREGTVVLVGPELPLVLRANLAAQNIHHVRPTDVLPSDESASPLALDAGLLPDGRNGNYALALRLGTRSVRFGRTEAVLPQKPFKLLKLLARAHRRGRPVVLNRVIFGELFAPKTSEVAVRGLVAELRRQLAAAFGKSDEVAGLIGNSTGQGYEIKLPPLSVAIEA